MSLSVAAFRIITHRALRGATSAGLRIFDSAVDPVALVAEEASPCVVIYADKGARTPTGKALFEAPIKVDLTLEMFVAKATRVKGSEGAQDFEIEYPATDEGYENLLRRLAYECESVLFGSAGAWPDLFREFVLKFTDHPSEWDRGADSQGRRFNYLRDQLNLEIIADPVRGSPIEPGTAWDRLLTQMAADSELDDLAKDWRSLISTPGLAEWQRARAELGLNDTTMSIIGVGPLAGVADGDSIVETVELSADGGGATISVTDAGATIVVDGSSTPVELVE